VCLFGASFIQHNAHPHSIFHTNTQLFTYTHAVIYTTLSSDICHYYHRKPGARSSTGDTKVVWSWPTSRSAVVRHQRARYAVWTDTSQTSRRGIPRHEMTRIVLDIEAQTCVYTRLEITVFVRIKIVEHAFCTGCAVRALLRELVVLCHGRYGPMSTHTQCVERRLCTEDSSMSCMSVKIDIHSLRVL